MIWQHSGGGAIILHCTLCNVVYLAGGRVQVIYMEKFSLNGNGRN